MNDIVMMQVKQYLEYFPSEIAKLGPLLAQIKLDSGAALCDRKTGPGHITASGIVVSDNSLLMINHPALGKWLQPGGHIELGETPIKAAMREVQEETGVSSSIHFWHQMNNFPIDIDIHRIPANEKKSEPAHLHFDFRYLLNGSLNLVQGEHPAAWIRFSDFQESNLLLLVMKIRNLESNGRRAESPRHS